MNLEIKLQEILDEKVKVLGDLERIIYSERYSLSEDHKRILSLQSINMMYSVWEGFITASLKEYINYINSKFSDISELTDNIIAYNMVTEVKQFINPPEEIKKNKFNHFTFTSHIKKLTLSQEIDNINCKRFCISKYLIHKILT